MKKFRIVTLGCRTNQYESQAYRDQLQQMGFAQAFDDEPADICIVNSCTVTESADSHSRHEIRQLARKNPGARIVVTGCLAERDPEAVRSLEGVTDIIGNLDKEQLISKIFPEDDTPDFTIKRFDAHTRAFVKVQDGCNSYCTYCIIPYVRGRSRSRSIPHILDEVKELIANGYKEIVLTGINIGDFDGDGTNTLAELVREVDQVPGLERLRVSSIDPDEVDDELLDAIINGKKTCRSMHIVLQAGSNVVLKRMNRKYTRQMFMEAVERLRGACPEFTFTTDIIVGFPGETDLDFQDTLDVMRQVRFAKVHMFPYSERKRTRAALYENKVSEQVKRERKQIVLRESERLAHSLREEYVGKTMTVLTENSNSGHTDNFLQVILDQELPSNQLVEVELLENTPEGLLGRVIERACCGV